MLTGLRPFESRDWITLLEKHAHQPPPRARTIRPDLPDAVDAALDRALSKDPNRRFATCTEFATALGCQLLSAPAPLAEVLLETTCKKMWGRWKTFVEPISLSIVQPRVHLTLAPDALWGTYRGMLMRWPLASIVEAKRRGKTLQLRLAVTKGKSVQKFKLRRRKECQAWAERLQWLIETSKKPEGDGPELPAPVAEELGEPRPDPIVVLKAKPSTRFQLLGPIDVKAAKRKLARPALAIRGVMMGADAIVDLQEERLAGAYRTEFRASGTAVRAVDREGRLELKARWFDAQARSLRFGMIALASFGLFGGIIQLLSMLSIVKGDARLIPATTVLALVGAVWMFTLSVAFGALRWPQLARPAAICFLGAASAGILSIVGSLIAAFATGQLVAGSIMLGFTLLGAVLMFSYFAFYLYLGRRSLAIDRDYRQIVADDEAEVNPTRRLVGRSAFALSVIYAAWLIGFNTWNTYQNYLATPGAVNAMQKAYLEIRGVAVGPKSPRTTGPRARRLPRPSRGRGSATPRPGPRPTKGPASSSPGMIRGSAGRAR